MAAANPKTGTGRSVRPEDEIGSIADRCLQVPILCVLSFSLPFQEEEVNVHFLSAALLCVRTRQMREAQSGTRADAILLRRNVAHKTRFLCVLPYLYVDFDVCLPKLLMLCL